MNKVILVGRIARDPETKETQSGIKYSRFAIAVDRPFAEDQTDFIPIVAWRNQADFIQKYLAKGSLISIEGRFTSSTYTNNDNQNITRYEVTAERVQSLETKAQREAREANSKKFNAPVQTVATETQVMEFAEENKPEDKNETKDSNDLSDVPWEIDL